MNLRNAPYRQVLRVLRFDALDDASLFHLAQIGLEVGEDVQKIQCAPLGDPVTLQIGESLIALRNELLEKVQVAVGASGDSIK